MPGIRNRIEAWFEKLAHVICANRYKTLFLMLAVVAASAWQTPKITINTTMEGFLHKDDPSLLAYEDFKDQFGRDQLIVIALNPPDVFDRGFLVRLKKLHDDLRENLPHLEDITSLINARNTYGENDELIVDDLLENWPETPEALEAVKKRAFNNPIYQNMLLSEDGRFTTIAIETEAYTATETDILEGFEDTASFETDGTFPSERDSGPRKYLTDEENSEVLEAVAAIVNRHKIAGTPIYVAGIPTVSHYIKISMLKDMGTFMAVAVLTIVFFLFLIFRRASGVFLPLIIVLFSLIATIGLMAATGNCLKMQTQILPSFLLAAGVGAAVHILAIFFVISICIMIRKKRSPLPWAIRDLPWS